MTSNPYEQFINLARLDQKMISDLKEQDALKAKNLELVKSLEDAQKDLNLSHQILINTKKKLDELQLELRSIDNDLVKKNRQLEVVQSPKQYDSLNHEIIELNQKKDNFENQILNLYDEIDGYSSNLEIKKSDFEKFQNLTQNFLKTNNLAIENLEKDFEEVNSKWAEAVKFLPPEWVEKYKKMKERISDPVVPVKSNSCSACFATITHSDINSLNHNKLIHCHECYRLLYIEK